MVRPLRDFRLASGNGGRYWRTRARTGKSCGRGSESFRFLPPPHRQSSRVFKPIGQVRQSSCSTTSLIRAHRHGGVQANLEHYKRLRRS